MSKQSKTQVTGTTGAAFHQAEQKGSKSSSRTTYKTVTTKRAAPNPRSGQAQAAHVKSFSLETR